MMNLGPNPALEVLDRVETRLITARVILVGMAILVPLTMVAIAIPVVRSSGIGDVLGLIGMTAVMVWIFLGFRSAGYARRLREATMLLSLGQADAAGERAEQIVESYNATRPVLLAATALLARVRHLQGRHVEAAQIADFVVQRRERVLGGEKPGIRLLLVDSLLSLGQTHLAHSAMLPLYREKLDLAQSLRLLVQQLRVETRGDSSAAMMQNLPSKLFMAELMPVADSVLVHAMLYRAASNTDHAGWTEFLGRRLRLLEPDAKAFEREPALRSIGPTLDLAE